MKPEINSYKDLIVWQKSMELVIAVYELTELYPAQEKYGLTAHTRKTSISITSNIAEGRRRSMKKDCHSYFIRAYASGAELETQIEIARRLPFGVKLNFTRVDSLLDEVMRMLNAMTNNLQS